MLTKQDMCTIYKSWIRPTLEYGSILYSEAANIHLRCLVDLQSHIERSCSFVFQTLSHRRNAAFMGLVCRLLAGEGRGNAHSFMVIRLFVGLIVFTPGTQLNIYVLSIPVILEHWTDLSAAGWLLLLIFGMGSQLI